jgi:hypothetical protein
MLNKMTNHVLKDVGGGNDKDNDLEKSFGGGCGLNHYE